MRRAASRTVRKSRREWRLGPQRGGGNLPTHEVLTVFSKPATYPGFADPPKPVESKKEAPPSIEAVQQGAADPTGLTGPLDQSDRSGRSSRV